MPFLDGKSKSRYTYFSSDDNIYFDTLFIHNSFVTKKTIISQSIRSSDQDTVNIYLIAIYFDFHKDSI